MPGQRYRVLNLPDKGRGAFTPIPTTTPAASSHGLVHVRAAWGTDPVPAPAPCALPPLTAAGKPNTAVGSDVVPSYIMPPIGIPGTANMGPEADTGLGMARRRFCELPIPARSPQSLATPAMVPAKIGGRRVIGWPRAFQRFPLIGSS